MALVNGPVGQNTSAAPVAKTDDAKAKKLEALQRFKERKAAKVKENFNNSLKLKDELTKLGLMEKLTPAIKDFVLDLCKDPSEKRASGGAGSSSIFTLLYGDHPKVGDAITLEEAFQKTYKGKSTLDVWVKRWAEKGTVVECQINKEKMLATKYVIKSMPQG